MRRYALAVAGVLLFLALCGGSSAPEVRRTASAAPGAPASAPAAAHRRVAPAGPACSRPAPTTASGYAALFASLDARQWGAADVSISVPLPDGRVLWLYGDTLKAGPMTHSSAIVQDRGCLHVVNRGAQILPNIDAHQIYWIRSAESAGPNEPDRVIITARAITLTGKGPWDFKDGGYDQMMSLWLDRSGDAAAPLPPQYGWALVSPLGPAEPTTAPDPGPMYPFGPHHFGYARHAHPEARLASGRTLVTTCQNWDDGTLHPFADYRPIFSEGPR